ncbi:hypothetical protein GF402_01830 [Candidatus Fermentibacteria bacterium]|nr:hypothetical protein [Candidatus Fermentibacteria bacterium]
MSKVWQYAVGAAAAVALCVLLWLLRRRGGGSSAPTWMVSVVSALCLISGTLHARPGPEAVTIESGDTENENSLRSLMATPTWGKLVSLWRDLDDLSPPDSMNSYYGYTSIVDYTKGDSLQAVLVEHREELIRTADRLGCSTKALRLVLDLTAIRVERLSRMDPMMMTRMAPPWTAMERSSSLNELELRIDTLLALYRSDAVSSEEVSRCMQGIFEKAVLWTVLEEIDTSYMADNWFYSFRYGYPRPGGTEKDPVETVIAAVEQHHDAMLDSLEKYGNEQPPDWIASEPEQYERFKAGLGDLQKALPELRLLLSDLVLRG